MRDVILSSMVVGLCASCGLAQSFNIDFGVATPALSPVYGAASGQVGFWNTYGGGTLPGLLTTSAAPTGVSVSFGGGSFLGFNPDPLTLGDDEALLDDGLSIPTTELYTITGLAPGSYNVYCYTWTFPVLAVNVDVNGQGPQLIGGAWTGSFTPGMYSLHNVTLAPSQPLSIFVSTVPGALGALTGVQIVPVPTPGAAGVLAAAGALAMGRRRR